MHVETSQISNIIITTFQLEINKLITENKRLSNEVAELKQCIRKQFPRIEANVASRPKDGNNIAKRSNRMEQKQTEMKK